MVDTQAVTVQERWSTPLTVIVVFVLVVIAGLVAGVADAAPTGAGGIDRVERVLAAGLLVMAGAFARRWTVLVLLTATTALSAFPLAVLGLVAMVGIVIELLVVKREEPIVGAAATAVAIALGFNLGDSGLARDLAFGATAAIVIIPSVLVLASALRNLPFVWRTVGTGVVVLTVLGAWIITAMTAVGAARATTELDDSVSAANRGLAFARDGEVESAQAELTEASGGLARAGDDLDGWWNAPSRWIPVVAQHQRAAVELTATGRNLSDLADDLTATAADEIFQGAEGRVDLDVVRSLQSPAADAAQAVDDALLTVGDVESPWLVDGAQRRIRDLETRLEEIQPSTQLVVDVADRLPAMLGGEGRRQYLMLLLTPSEARELGGLSGSWAEIGVEDGLLTLDQRGRSDDVVLDGLALPDRFPTAYRQADPGAFPMNWSSTADFPTAADGAALLYRQATGRRVDGVIALDADALAEVIAIAGSVQVPGFEPVLTADTAREFLLYEQYELFPDRLIRSVFLNALIDTTFEQLTTGDLPEPEQLLDALGPMVEQDHLRVLTFDEDEQALLVRLGLDGQVGASRNADTLGVFHTNTSRNKLDAYLNRTVATELTIDPVSNALTGTVRVELASSAPTTGQPDIVLATEGFPDGTNRSQLTLLTMHEVRIEVDGQVAPQTALNEYGLNRYSVDVVIPAGTTVAVEFELTGQVDGARRGRQYRLDLLHQPVVIDDTISVTILDDNGEPWEPTETVPTTQDRRLETAWTPP